MRLKGLLCLCLSLGCMLCANQAKGMTDTLMRESLHQLPEECSDSIRVTNMLRDARNVSNELHKKIIFFAKGFLGTPYAGGTLETFPLEHLVVRTDSVDCTTFVEYVLAMVVTDRIMQSQPKHPSSFSKQVELQQNPYQLFKSSLQSIRYRNGQIDGYTSRLHYFSDWIVDNQNKGYVKEVTRKSPHLMRTTNLNFMSEHASLYPFLANDTTAVRLLKEVEYRFLHYEMPYIAKQELGRGQEILDIQDGDILTFVTNVKGLDVVHVGFALWIQGKLHLLHASSKEKHVLVDPSTIFDYSKNKKSHLGIRVIRIL